MLDAREEMTAYVATDQVATSRHTHRDIHAASPLRAQLVPFWTTSPLREALHQPGSADDRARSQGVRQQNTDSKAFQKGLRSPEHFEESVADESSLRDKTRAWRL